MTPLTKPVTRKSNAVIRDRGKLRELIITLYPGDVMGLRPIKTRKEEVITLESCYSLAVKQRVAKERAEKAAKKMRRKA